MTNQLPPANSNSSTIRQPYIVLGLNATASRRSTWSYAAKGQHDLIDFIVKSGEVAPMLRIGYFSGEDRFQATRWMDDAKRLQDWMQTLNISFK